MKKVLFALIVTVVFASCSGISKNMGKVEVNNQQDSLSYCIGVSIGMNIDNYMESMDTELNMEVFKKAFEDKMNEDELLIPEDQVNMIIQTISQKMMGEMGEKSKAKGEAFLEENKQNSDVQVTESGLQYEILKEGNGPKPEDGDMVSVHYTGTMIDGEKFDSSFDRGQPAQFNVNQVIPGWTEALKLMPVGSKWKLYIPSELAYGTRPPQGSSIKPNSVLIFEVELLEILSE